MKRARLRHHLPAAEENTGDFSRATEPAAALHASEASQLDVCRCPKCDGPMTARHGPTGPYFHCQCVERKRQSGVARNVNKTRAAEESMTRPAVANAVGSPILVEGR